MERKEKTSNTYAIVNSSSEKPDKNLNYFLHTHPNAEVDVSIFVPTVNIMHFTVNQNAHVKLPGYIDKKKSCVVNVFNIHVSIFMFLACVFVHLLTAPSLYFHVDIHCIDERTKETIARIYERSSKIHRLFLSGM